MITGLGSARDLAFGKKGAFYNTLEEFHKYWDRVDIIASRSLASGNSRSQASVLFGNVFIHISPWPLAFHPLWFLKKGLEIYKEQKFDLMTVQDFPPFYNGIAARLLWSRLFKEKSRILDSRSESGQRIRVPYILEFHHIPGYPRAANLKEKIYAQPLLWKFYWKIFGSKAAAVRVVNQKQAPEFFKKVGVPERKIVYIPSAYIDLDVFKPTDYGLPTTAKEYDLIFIGRLEPNKGVSFFLDAIKILNTKYKIQNTKVLIVGDGPLRDWVQSQITSYQLPITNFGWAKDSREIAELMNRSKILVMPSYNEGGPRVVLEAMACGVPVLATNVGLIPDFADENTVKIIDWNAEDIAQKAKELLENESERRRLSQAGLEIAKRFEKKEMIKNYAEKLKSLSSL